MTCEDKASYDSTPPCMNESCPASKCVTWFIHVSCIRLIHLCVTWLVHWCPVAACLHTRLQGGEDPQDTLSFKGIFRKRALWLVALLRKMTCNLRRKALNTCMRLIHSCVWHDSSTRVTWLIHMCDMTHPLGCDRPHSRVWHDSSTHVCDMTHPHVWHDSSTCVTWLIHLCVAWLIHVCGMTPPLMCDMPRPHVWRDSSTRVTWLIHLCVTGLIHACGMTHPLVCDMTHPQVWHDSSWHDSSTCVVWLIHSCVTGLIHVCDMTHPHVWHDSSWHDSSTCVVCLIHMCDMVHPYVYHDPFKRKTWLSLKHHTRFAYRVAKMRRMSYLHRSFSAKEPYN